MKFQEIRELVKKYPNDMELGGKVREYFYNLDKQNTQGEGKIFESPDGGKTVYERPLNSDISERKLVTNQLNLFES